MLTFTIGFALYYLAVGTLVWFIEFGRSVCDGEFDGGNTLLAVAISVWIIVAWPEVLRCIACHAWSRGWRS